MTAFALTAAAVFVGAAAGPLHRRWLAGAPEAAPEAPPADTSPEVEIVVVMRDEHRLIGGKIENLRRLDYPAGRWRAVIVDGASTDGSAERARSAIAGDPRFTLLPAGRPGKTEQLNAALARASAPWILVTDADARFAPGTLRRLLSAAGPDVGAVGATVRPAGAHPLERLHWRLADAARLAESARGSASIVTAPCYLFRRELVPSLPADAVADDVHVALRAASAGFRVAFVRAGVRELRAPRTFGQFLRHKSRKAAAYAREVIRFWPQSRRMRKGARAVFRWRAAQLAAAPICPALLLAAGGAGETPAAVIAGLCLLAAAAASPSGRRPRGWLDRLALGPILCAVVAGALVSLLFRRPSSRLPKIHDVPAPAGERSAP